MDPRKRIQDRIRSAPCVDSLSPTDVRWCRLEEPPGDDLADAWQSRILYLEYSAGCLMPPGRDTHSIHCILTVKVGDDTPHVRRLRARRSSTSRRCCGFFDQYGGSLR